MNRSQVSSTPGEGALILLLVWAAGGVDAISYLGLGRVFTANMTGNTVLLGMSVGQGQLLAAERSLAALVGYAIGVAIGAFVVDRKPAITGWTPAVTTALAIELAILACFTAVWHVMGAQKDQGALLLLLIGLSATAMGIQSAAVRRLGLPGIVTTYITGTLTSVVAGLVTGLRSRRAPMEPTLERRSGVRWERRLILQASVLVVYGCAATFSTIVQQRRPSLATLSPLAALLLVVAGAIMLSRRTASSHAIFRELR